MKPVIVVHGGAGTIVKEYEDQYCSGVNRAALKGYNVLKQGGSALTAVEEAVVVMEDDTLFNAERICMTLSLYRGVYWNRELQHQWLPRDSLILLGVLEEDISFYGCGSVLNEEGEVEMDAIIMDGKNLDSGAVSAVRCIANPIKLARLVMEKTDHMLLTSKGASLFAKSQGIQEVPGETLISERSRERWKTNLKPGSNPVVSQIGLGTVGAVAIDSEGNVACATSTGGLTNKIVGRVGDTACIGSGGYADNIVGAVSTTGHGESIMKVVLAKQVLHYMEQGMTAEEAAEAGLNTMKTRVDGFGGVIVVSRSGDWAAKFSTKQMTWAVVKADVLQFGIYHDENQTVPVNKALYN